MALRNPRISSADPGLGGALVIAVGSLVIHKAIWPEREIVRTHIVRETPTQWVDAHGRRWRKSTLTMVPQYEPEPRAIVEAPTT